MNKGFLKQASAVFLMTLALYVAAYSCDAHLRQRNGPWQLTFMRETNGEPAVVIRQPKLNIAEVKIVFAGEHAPENFSPATVIFSSPAMPVPFGEWVFDDLMYLPGTVTLNLFGHGVEMLPRALTVDHKEYAWQARLSVVAGSAEKHAAAEPKRK